MFELIGGVILGGIVTWVITRWYYLRANRDQQILFKKLTSEVREIILSDKSESITVAQLNELLRKKTLDTLGNEKLPYKICPKCGSEKLIRNNDVIVEEEYGDDGMPFQIPISYETIQCCDCGWKDDEIKKDYERIMK